jgi:hypothetical protein
LKGFTFREVFAVFISTDKDIITKENNARVELHLVRVK